MTEPSQSDAILQIVHAASRARRQDILAKVLAEYGPAVQSGPFAGMVLPERTAWGDGDLLPKLLGCYEAELHEVISEIAAAGPDLVINIGAAEGYYAVGMALLVPEAFIHAFDSAGPAQDICRQAAAANHVTTRVSVSGTCTPDLLQAILPRGRRPVVICDCEGAERDLIDPQKAPALRNTIMIVECHDFLDPTITQTLANRLDQSHTLVGVQEGARDPNVFPLLRGLNSLDRWLAICEYRPSTMHWIIARPR